MTHRQARDIYRVETDNRARLIGRHEDGRIVGVEFQATPNAQGSLVRSSDEIPFPTEAKAKRWATAP